MVGYNDPNVGGKRRNALANFLRNQSMNRAKGAARLKGLSSGTGFGPLSFRRGGDSFDPKIKGDDFSGARRGDDFSARFLPKDSGSFNDVFNTMPKGGSAPINMPFFGPSDGGPTDMPFFGPGGGSQPVGMPFFPGSGPAEPVGLPFFGPGGGSGEPVGLPFFPGSGYGEPVGLPFFPGSGGSEFGPVGLPFFSPRGEQARIPNRKSFKPILGDLNYGTF